MFIQLYLIYLKYMNSSHFAAEYRVFLDGWQTGLQILTPENRVKCLVPKACAYL